VCGCNQQVQLASTVKNSPENRKECVDKSQSSKRPSGDVLLSSLTVSFFFFWGFLWLPVGLEPLEDVTLTLRSLRVNASL